MSAQRNDEVLNGKVILSNLRKSYRFRKVTLQIQLISSVNGDPLNEMRGKMGKECYLEKGEFVGEREAVFDVTFDWDEKNIGKPGAISVRNNHHSVKFFLKSLTLEGVSNLEKIHFDCNSWIHPKRYNTDGYIFFANKAYLPSETPMSLEKYREDELMKLRGDGTGKRKKWEKIYDYDVYNDISDLDSNLRNKRPILGGSHRYPYPRRGRTGRPCSKIDDKYETICSIKEIYVPSDERFGYLKKSDFDDHKCKSAHQIVKDTLKASFGKFPRQFDSLQDVFALYERRSFHRRPKFPLPQVIKDNKTKWRTDEEFAREMLAGVNPMIIRRLQEFPPSSNLDPNVYGDQTSKISNEHIMHNLDGLTVDEAIMQNKLYILDYHDILIPYLREINTKTTTRTYATRTLLFLNRNGTLKPLAIELSLPHPQGDQFGVFSRILLPHATEIGESLWQLAKGYVIVNDAGYHQLVSHWLNTHAVIEPFVIATNRQLSVLHPIHKLLVPHFRYTMKINSLARGALINADGIIEKTQYPSKYSMEMSSMAYRSWNFTEQALPADLIKRGIAIEDASSPHGLRLLINDYPYAVDGLDIWTTIKTWVVDYCTFYYENDEMICNDIELQSWWKELREKGHEDKKDEPWWPKMQNVEELINSCTIIIWISSALHAAVNFGQYPYGGFLPNRPSTSKSFLPEEGTNDYQELQLNPEKVFLKIFTSKPQNDLLNISTIELLSTHSRDEFYLGQRSNPEWTFDKELLDAFEKFKDRLVDVEEMIVKKNQDSTLKNRVGLVEMPYTLLHPSSKEGLTFQGIPNSISI